jgi:hypothetical protein
VRVIASPLSPGALEEEEEDVFNKLVSEEEEEKDVYKRHSISRCCEVRTNAPLRSTERAGGGGGRRRGEGGFHHNQTCISVCCEVSTNVRSRGSRAVETQQGVGERSRRKRVWWWCWRGVGGSYAGVVAG